MKNTVTIFRKKIDVSEEASFEFQSLGFLFEVNIKNLKLLLADKYQIISVRLTLNRTITSNIDCTISDLGTIKNELILLKTIFSSNQALNILENIDD